MVRARPNAIAPEPAAAAAAAATSRGAEAGADDQQRHQDQQEDHPAAVLTVWRKSLLLSCSGFTVFDASGALAFRVDNYDAASRGLRRRAAGEVVLMDEAGTPLLTVRRCRRRRLATLGLAPDRWLIFNGDGEAGAAEAAGCRRPDKAKPFLSVRRARRHALGFLLGASSSSSSSSGSSKAAPLAYVTPLLHASGAGEPGEAAYVVEGSYGARACAVRDARGDPDAGVVAEVRRKERVGDDVFRLVVPGPRLGAPLAMALVIALDQMFAAAAGGSGSASARRPSLLRRTWSA